MKDKGSCHGSGKYPLRPDSRFIVVCHLFSLSCCLPRAVLFFLSNKEKVFWKKDVGSVCAVASFSSLIPFGTHENIFVEPYQTG